MSQLTDYGENRLIDFIRSNEPSLPSSWYISLGSLELDSDGVVIPDSTFTEFTGTGYARQAVARSLTNWAGTQGAGSVQASTGASHATSNNVVINFGTSGSAWGTATHVAFNDASSGGNKWIFAELEDPMVIGNGEPVTIPIEAISMSLGLSGGMTNYLANKMIDWLFRGQSASFISDLDNYYFGYSTTTPSNAGAATEPNVGGYARAVMPRGFTYWSATSIPGDTGSSEGTDGRTSNNIAIQWPAPTADQGDVSHVVVFDAATLGNMLFWTPIQAVKTIAAGSDAPAYNPDKFGITLR